MALPIDLRAVFFSRSQLTRTSVARDEALRRISLSPRPLPRDKLTSSRSKANRCHERSLATFGNPFGLALYDREQLGVREAKSEKTSPAMGPWVLRSGSGAVP